MKKPITILLILTLLPLSSLVAKPRPIKAERESVETSSFEKEVNGNPKVKKSHWFGTVLLITLGLTAIGVVLYFTVIKKTTYTLAVTVSEGVTGTPAAGNQKYNKGQQVSYNYTANPGYKLTVTLDGSPVAASGMITMNGNHTLIATAQQKGNYMSITFRFKYTLSGLNVAPFGECLLRYNQEFLKTVFNLPDANITQLGNSCDQAVLIKENSVDYQLMHTAMTVRQSFIFTKTSTNLSYPNLLCSSAEFTILSYTWETGKADPGSPQIQGLENIPIVSSRDYKPVNGDPSSIWCLNDALIQFVPPGDPKNAPKVFVVGCGGK